MIIVITHGNSNGNSTGAVNDDDDDDDASPPSLRLYISLSLSKRRPVVLKNLKKRYLRRIQIENGK